MIHKAWTFAMGNADDLRARPTCSTRSMPPWSPPTPRPPDRPQADRRNGWPPDLVQRRRGGGQQLCRSRCRYRAGRPGRLEPLRLCQAPGSVGNVCTPPRVPNSVPTSPPARPRSTPLPKPSSRISAPSTRPPWPTARTTWARKPTVQAEGLRCPLQLLPGPRACEIVAGDIDPDALCKLWVIPARLIAAPAAAADPPRLPMPRASWPS